jgi:hypothetical protein
MTVKEWAEKLNGREYGEEVSPEESRQMADEGMIAVFGASDDLLEFRGDLYDECGAWEGIQAKLYKTNEGKIVLANTNGVDEIDEHLQELIEKAIARMLIVEAKWCPKELETSWLIETEIPHETFDIYEDGELYCRGIVFQSANIPIV